MKTTPPLRGSQDIFWNYTKLYFQLSIEIIRSWWKKINTGFSLPLITFLLSFLFLFSLCLCYCWRWSSCCCFLSLLFGPLPRPCWWHRRWDYGYWRWWLHMSTGRTCNTCSLYAVIAYVVSVVHLTFFLRLWGIIVLRFLFQKTTNHWYKIAGR